MTRLPTDDEGDPTLWQHRNTSTYHVHVVVIPERHDKDHAAIEGVAHLLEAAAGLEGVGVVERLLLIVAIRVADRVVRLPAHRHVGHRHHLAALHEEPADLTEFARVRAVRGDELGHHGERLGGGGRRWATWVGGEVQTSKRVRKESSCCSRTTRHRIPLVRSVVDSRCVLCRYSLYQLASILAYLG